MQKVTFNNINMIFTIFILLAIYLQSVSILILMQGISEFKGAINVMARTGHDTAGITGSGPENEQ